MVDVLWASLSWDSSVVCVVMSSIFHGRGSSLRDAETHPRSTATQGRVVLSKPQTCVFIIL